MSVIGSELFITDCTQSHEHPQALSMSDADDIDEIP